MNCPTPWLHAGIQASWESYLAGVRNLRWWGKGYQLWAGEPRCCSSTLCYSAANEDAPKGPPDVLEVAASDLGRAA